MTTSLESLRLLERAAELRAAGNRWPDTATQLAVGVEELRKLASEHTRDYERLVRRSRTAVLHETLAAALAALRAQLTSPDTRVSFLAATTIVRYELARMRHGAKEAGAKLQRMTQWNKRSIDAREVSNWNASEMPEVQNRQEVISVRKVEQPQVPNARVSVPSQPAPTPATPARDGDSPVPAANAFPVAPAFLPVRASVTGKNAGATKNAIRSNKLLVDKFARGRAPITKAAPQTLEAGSLMRSWLADK